MKKLLDGIRDFHERVRPAYRERFAHLAQGQAPDCLFVACSDSRVVPNLFASTDPGDLFVIRNVGNVVPRPGERGDEGGSSGAAIEFATLALGVRDIVVCGHSGCGAMRTVLAGKRPARTPNLDKWLGHANPSLGRLERETGLDPSLPEIDRLSRAHVLQQVDHLAEYPCVASRLAENRITIHAWWFDLAHAMVLAFDPFVGDFVPLVQLMDQGRLDQALAQPASAQPQPESASASAKGASEPEGS